MIDELFKDYYKYSDFYDIFNKYRNYEREMRFLFRMIKDKKRVLDLGCGTGTHLNILENVGYIVDGLDLSENMVELAKTKVKKITAFEIQKESANMAKNSVALNNMSDRIEVVNESLESIEKILSPQSVNVVISNPPYMKKSGAVKNSSEKIAIARHEIKCTLQSVIKAAAYVLKPNGRFYMIHKPERLSEIINDGIKYNLEVKRLRFVVPEKGKNPTMVLVEYVKCAASGMTVESELVVYKDKGVYSEEVEKIYGR